jgi:thermostable 8-oxoguanine DNA glycosylase
MITASQIAHLRTSSLSFNETEKLKAKITQLRAERRPFFLTATEFDEILKWKLRDKHGGQRALREANTDEVVQAITSLALSITHSDKDYELELRVGILCALRGVGVPAASAVLTIVCPDEYAVIDSRGWRQIYNEERTMFSAASYTRYMQEIRRLSRELGWPVQEVGLAIWEYDRRYGTDDIS